jgi:hypothetical protein
METTFVRAVFDLDCEWYDDYPRYRIYVNDELFTERTWTWTDHYLQEVLQISAAPGQYKIRVEPVGRTSAVFTQRNFSVEQGSARWIDNVTLEIAA